MAYNNNYSYRGGNGGRQNWGGNNNGYGQGGYGQQQRQYKKHTGAKFGLDKNGNPYVTGWNYSKSKGLVTFFCRPYKGTKKSKSTNGREWHNWFVTIKQGFNEVKTSGLYDPAKQFVLIKEYGLVVNPKARNGGYCGTNKKRN